MESLGISSLALSLFALAVGALVAVIAHNAWSGRRRRGATANDGGGGADSAQSGSGTAVASGERRRAEPSFGAPEETAGVTPEAEPPLPAAADGQAAPRLDPLTDCIIEFELDAPVAAERLLPTLQGLRRAGAKPVVVEGCLACDDARANGANPQSLAVDGADADPQAQDPVAQPDWIPVTAGRRLSRVRIGVLLANRHGPLNAMEYSEFVAGVQALADQLAVLGDTPDMGAVLQRARSLDERLAALDALVGINVQASQPLGPAELAGLARECGCVERGNNRFARLAPGGEVLFSLSLSDLPERLSLLLDVPRAPAGASPWESLLECARHCATRLDGRLVDDQGRELAEGALARIGEQVSARQQALTDAGIEPGSVLALRVFN